MAKHLKVSPHVRAIWLTAISYWVVVAALCCFLYPATISDTLARYAPMADHFARGEWSLAFHPRFGVLFEMLSGLVVKVFGVPGDQATQIVSIGLLSLSVVPLWFLVRQLFDARIAWWSVALMLFSDDFSRYAFDGLRDTGKCLAFALVGLGVVRRDARWFAAGLFVLVTLASYCFAVASVLLLVWCVYWLYAICRQQHIERPIATFAWPIGLWVLASAAVVGMTHAYTGHWLPSPHYVKILGGWL